MKTVLYIDDNTDDLFLFQRACQMARVSFALELAEGSRPALLYLSGDGKFADRAAFPLPQIILLDIKMPEMDGFEVLNWIRARPQVSKTLVAMYSSSTFDKDVLRGYLSGGTFYIPKPPGTAGLIELACALDECVQSNTKHCERLIKLSLTP